MRNFFNTLLLLTSAYATAADDIVQHSINIDRATQHEAQVKSIFPATSAPSIVVKMPNWRTGRYQILNLANGVRDFKAFGDNGRELAAQKIDKASWQIQKKAGEVVTIQYDLYGNELGLRVRHIDDTHAFLDASGVWMYSDESRALPLTVNLTVPEGWQSRSGLTSCAAHCFSAAKDRKSVV